MSPERGQTFEKATVVEILQDNLQADGTRVGEQKVVVRMDSGERKGEELTVTSSSGYLFGAGCTPGMHVIVMQSVAGESVIASVYSQDRGWVIYLFAALYILLLCVIGGKQGIKGSAGTDLHLFLCDLRLSSSGVPGPVSFLGGGFCMRHHYSRNHVPYRSPTKKTLVSILGTMVGVLCAGISAQLFSFFPALPDITYPILRH